MRLKTFGGLCTSLGGAALAAALCGAPALAQLASPPVKIPSADPVSKVIERNPVFRDGHDAAPGPIHPPLDQIQAMPMPRPPAEPQPESLDRTMSLYDASTGEWVTTPTVLVNPGAGSGGVAGWRGPLPSSDDPSQNTFGNLSVAGGLTSYPAAPNCKLAMRFTAQNGNQYWFACSGTMIDPGVVMTAGHCVYTRNFTDNSGNNINVFNWADIIYVYPAWDGNVAPVFNAPQSEDVVQNFGYSSGTFYMAGTDWIQNGNFARDQGYVRLNNRHPGQLTGWMGWWFDTDCAVNFDTGCGRNFTNYAYPAENCGGGLHTGQTMYVWSGCFDSCNNNQGVINTSGGCFNAGWGGMSGSSAYFTNSGSQYVRGVSSNSNRGTRASYAMTWTQLGQTDIPNFISGTRGTNFDLQALRYRTANSTIQAGAFGPAATFLAGNITNASRGVQSYTIRIYLSSNSIITAGDTLLATYTYNLSFGALGTVNMNVPSFQLPTNITPGTYWIGAIFDNASDGNSGNNATSTWDALRVTITQAAPFNDSCASATPLSLGSGLQGSTLLANNDGSATCGTSAGTADVFYSFQAPCDGRYAFYTCNPVGGFDTVLSLHSGCPANSGNQFGCDDDTACTNIRDSRVELNMTQNQLVIVRVSGFNGLRGDFTVAVANLFTPANDLCSAALAIDDGSAVPFDTCGAGTEQGAPGGCFDRQIYSDLWFLYTAPADAPRNVVVTTCDLSTDDTIIAIYRASECPAEGSAITCNDDSCDLQSLVAFEAQPNEVFMIRLGNYANGSTSTGSISVQSTVVPTPCFVDFNSDGFLNQEDLGGYLTAFLDESIPPGPSGTSTAPCLGEPQPYDELGYAADYNRDCTVNQEDLSGFITEYFGEAETPANCIPG